MCNHILGLNTYYQVQRPKAVWRCSACGREARLPVDCCTSPNFATPRQAGLVHAGARWLVGMASSALMGLCAMLRRRSAEHTAPTPMPEPIGVRPVTAGLHDDEQTEAEEVLTAVEH